LVVAYVPAPGGAGANDPQWYAAWHWLRAVGQSAIATDPENGVWVYGAVALSDERGQLPHGQLRHLALEGEAEDARIVELPSGPADDQIPRLVNPRMAVASDSTVWLVGETGAGDMLVEVRGGAVKQTPVPWESSRGRRSRAVDVAPDGALLLATDGAGVLTYRDGAWGAHPITEHLPVLEGSDLKPVDDILVTEDGTLYAACQFQVVIWKPD
jgi:hypothetical protein